MSTPMLAIRMNGFLLLCLLLVVVTSAIAEAKDCGELNQKACPKIYFGYPCKGKLAPNANKICKPCGGLNQKACRALKPGKQCDEALIKVEGNCVTCGELNQQACPKIKTEEETEP